MDMPPNLDVYCNLLLFTVVTTGSCSSYFIVFMTFERFYSIIRPHKAASFNTVKKAKISIPCIVVYCILTSIPHLYITDHHNRDCFSNYDSPSLKIYFWVGHTSVMIIPFLSLVAMNSVIIYTLRQRSKSRLTRSHAQSQGQTEGQNDNEKSYERQIYTMLLLVTFGYLTLTTPVFVMNFWQTFFFRGTAKHFAISNFVFKTGGSLYCTNNGINFLFYVLSGSKFRNDLKNLFISCRIHQHKSPFKGTSEENQLSYITTQKE